MAESGAQLFARLGAKESLGDLSLPLFSHLPLGLRAGDTVELCGGEGTAKSELLCNITAHCVLPRSWKSVNLPGRSIEVVYISTDYKFDVLRLVTVLEGRIQQACNSRQVGGASRDPADYEELIKACLSRAHILYCRSSTELLATLLSLKTFVSNHPEVCVLILDNVASFYWTDRCETGNTGMASASEHRQLPWVGAFAELVQEHHLVAFAAKPHIFGRSRSKASHSNGTQIDSATTKYNVANSVSCEEFMGRRWQRLVKYRFHLERSQETIHVHEAQDPSLPGSSGPSLSVLDHARMFGTFTATQVYPVGPVHRFAVMQCGVEFAMK